MPMSMITREMVIRYGVIEVSRRIVIYCTVILAQLVYLCSNMCANLVIDITHAHSMISPDPCIVGKNQSVMKIEDIELDPNPPQKGEPVTVSVKAKLCKSYIYS